MLATLFFCLALPPAAQQAPRLRTSIHVVDAKGEAWVGARVRLVSNVFAGIVPDANGRLDRWTDSLTAVTDGRGRVVVELLPGRRYTAWAASAIDADRYRASDLVDGLTAGAGGELREASSYWRERVRIVGQAAWKQAGPFELSIESPGEMTQVVRSAPPESGIVVMPMFPAARPFAWARLFTKDSFHLGSRQTVPQPTSEPRPAIRELTVGLPAAVFVRVTTPAGAPIAGARVFTDVSNYWIALGKTDASGNSIFRLPLRSIGDNRRIGISCIVRADGYATAKHRATITVSGTPRDEAELLRNGRPDSTIVMVEERTVRGRVLLGDDRPAAGMPLAIGTSLARGSATPARLERPILSTTDSNGRFEIRGLGPGSAWRLLAVPSAATLTALAGRKTIAPVVWLGGGRSSTKPVDLGDIRFDRLARIDVQVVSHTGERARGADLLLAEPGAYNQLDEGVDPPVALAADRAGQVRLLVNRHGQPALGAHRSGGAAYAELPQRTEPLAMTLSPTVIVTGQLVGPEINFSGTTFTAYVQGRNVRAHPWLVGRLPYRWSRTIGVDGKFAIPVPANSRVRFTAATERHDKFRWTGSATLKTTEATPKPLAVQLEPQIWGGGIKAKVGAVAPPRPPIKR